MNSSRFAQLQVSEPEQNTNKSVSEYIGEFIATLDTDDDGKTKDMGEKKYIADNYFEICRMIREFGIYYVEDLMFVRRIMMNDGLMENIKISVHECLTKLLNLFEAYYTDIDGQNENFVKFFVDNLDNENINNLFEYKEKNYNVFKNYIFSDNISCGELVRVINSFNEAIEKNPEIIKTKISEGYSEFNNNFIEYIKSKLHEIHGIPYDELVKIDITLLYTQIFTDSGCLTAKRTVSKKNRKGYNCVGFIKNKFLKEQSIIFKTQEVEKFKEPVTIIQTGMYGRNIFMKDKHTYNIFINYLENNHKLLLAGLSNTTTKLLTLINMFTYANQKSINTYFILALMIYYSPRHHSCAEIIMASKLFKYYNNQNILTGLCNNVNIRNHFNIENILELDN